MTDNTIAPEGRRLVFRGLLIGGIVAALLLIVIRKGGSAGGRHSSGVAMVFTGVTNSSGSNYARFTITNHPGYVSFHFVCVEAPTPTGWSVLASNVPVRPGPWGLWVPLSATNERVRFVFEVGTGSRPPFDWLRWLWLNNPRLEFLTNEATLPPLPSAGK